MGIGMKIDTKKTEEKDPASTQPESSEKENVAAESVIKDAVESNQVVEDSVSPNTVSSLKDVNATTAIDRTPSSGNSKNTIILIIVIVSLVIIGFCITHFLQNKKDASAVDDGNTTSEEVATPDNTITGVDDGALTFKENSAEATTSDNPNAVYDESGNLVSENGVYDTDGNIIKDDPNLINPGDAYSTTEQDAMSTTSATVYSASDYIKDLNGLDISAVYNVKSISYVHDYANYERKRAIIDQGMEMYWFELEYKGLKYRMQVSYDDYKNFDDTGIVRLNIEVLNLEGGEKIISFAQIAHDLDDTY